MTAAVTDPLIAGHTETEESTPEAEKMVLIACSDEMDKAWPVLILGTTGAAYGMDVTIFFTFWGLNLLKKPDAGITGDNWKQKMLAVFNRGSTQHLKLSKMNFAGMGPKMMGDLAKQYNVSSVPELLTLAQDMGVTLWPCGMTMELMGLKTEDLIDGLPDPAGAGSAVALMKESSCNLFI